MKKGRVTIPTDESFVEGTKKIAELWGADAVRDCDGTRLPANASDDVLRCERKNARTYAFGRRDRLALRKNRK